MKGRQSRWRGLLGCGFVAAVFALGFVLGGQARQPGPESSVSAGDLAAVEEAFALIQARYIEPIEAAELVDGAIAGMARALEDDYSAYIQPELCPRVMDFSGEFSGIGVMVERDDETGEIAVVSVLPGSPAEAAGVLPGDVFHAVDGQVVADFTLAELSALVPGPRGAGVSVAFRRGGELLTMEITRDVFELPNVSWEIVGVDIAYIRMLDFHDLSRKQLDEALRAAAADSRSGLILDIRGNPGGTLASAVEVASAFIAEGEILRQAGRDQREGSTMASGGYAGISAPIVVLVDESSASAAEALAGALQDHGIATIMGMTTAGKGTVQQFHALANGGCLRLTVSRWLRSNGEWIQGRGIEPDVVVEWDSAHDEGGQIDKQLEAATGFLSRRRD